jgi:acyl-CoA dehydrogenase
MRLSSDDLPMFFAAHHHELAARLRAAAPRIAAGERAADPDRAAVDALAETGLLALVAPGDGQVDVRAVCLAREMLGHVSPRADSIFAVQGLGAYPLLATGHDVAGYATGRRVGAFALTEPEAGSDVAALASRAVRDGDAWILDGDKLFISNLGLADEAVVFATVDPARGRRGITAFRVPLDAAGVAIERIEPIAPHPLGRLRLAGCRLPAGAQVGEVGAGFALAMQTLDTYRVSVGAAAVGMARRALDEAVAFVRERRQFGRPLAEQPLVMAHVADMICDLDAARLLVLRAAWARGAGRATTEASIAKLAATEAAQRVIDRAVQLLGGRGVVAGAVVEQLYRAIRPLRIYEGTSEIQRTIIGRAVLAREEAP